MRKAENLDKYSVGGVGEKIFALKEFYQLSCPSDTRKSYCKSLLMRKFVLLSNAIKKER